MDCLPDLVLNHIAGFLDAKSLLKFVLCKPSWPEVLDHKLVLKAAFAQGGNCRKSMEIMFKLCVVRRVVYLPSPLRLLKLANGKHCEAKGCSNVVKHVRKRSGLFLCWDCYCHGNMRVFREESMLDGNHRHLAAKFYRNSCYIRKTPFVATFREVAGPILTVVQMLQGKAIPKALSNNNPNLRICAARPRKLVAKELGMLWRAKYDGIVWRDKRREEKQERVQGMRQLKLEKCYSILQKLRSLASPHTTALSRIRFTQRRHWSIRCSPYYYNGPAQFRDMMHEMLAAPSRCTLKKLGHVVEMLKVP